MQSTTVDAADTCSQEETMGGSSSGTWMIAGKRYDKHVHIKLRDNGPFFFPFFFFFWWSF